MLKILLEYNFSIGFVFTVNSWVLCDGRFPNNMRLKDTRYDCEWEDEDDLNLMVGVFRHGMGNWDAIKMDPSLHLEDKVKYKK